VTSNSEDSLTARAGWGASESAGELTLHAAVVCWTWSWTWSWSWSWCWLAVVSMDAGSVYRHPGRRRAEGFSRLRRASIWVVWLPACCRYLAAVVLGTETCISEQPVFWFSVRVYLAGTRAATAVAATAGVSSSSSKPNSEQQEQPGPHDARCNHGWLVDQTGAEAGRCARRSLV
jgi:hypothetical protein